MKIILFLFVFLSLLHSNNTFNNTNKRTCIIPMSDAYPNRYFYHTPFEYGQFDVARQWICRGNGAIRYQTLNNILNTTNFLFDNPIIATSNGVNNTYNGGVMGLGWQELSSKNDITLNRYSYFVDCTIEITRLNLPYYLQIGIPIQRTTQSIDWNEEITSDQEVIKGGFTKEYSANSSVSISSWENTPSPIIGALSGMKQYMAGASIGNLIESQFGKLSLCPMTMWGLADIYIQLGYDGWAYQKTNFGYYLRGIIPTSPALKSAWNKYIFYPTIGNVDRWEMGIGINGNSSVFDNDSSGLIIYFDGYFGYMPATCHMRPFDLRNGFFSRYGQVKMFERETITYKNSNIRAVDITTKEYLIGNSVKTEAVLDIVYQRYQSYWNIGYSFKSQSSEKILCDSASFPCINASKTPFMYGYSPQQYTQTPNPDQYNSQNWTCNLITPNSSLQELSSLDISNYKDTAETINGIFINESNELRRGNLNLESALMPMQILNILFLGYNFKKIESLFDIVFGFKGAISFSPIAYYTPSFYEGMVFLELNY